MFRQKDIETIRKLADEYMNIAESQSQQEKTLNWRKLNSLKPSRPVVMIDQIPWHEMNGSGELDCVCEDGFLRNIEYGFRAELFKVKNFGGDMVIPPVYNFGKSWSDTGVGVGTVNLDESGHENAQTHLYVDQLRDDEALAKMHRHEIKYNHKATMDNKALFEEVLGDIMPVQPVGTLLWLAVWDRITFWRGAETCLYSLVDEPEFVHRIMKKAVDIENDYITQLERENLFYSGPGAKCHCIETYLDEPYADGFDPQHYRAKDCFVSGAAQIFSEVSPEMHNEFEIEYMKPLYERFGWVNYGCCEPLHKKIDIIKKIKTGRAVSTSPWADVRMTAEALGRDYVMARKPNPSFVASGYPDKDSVIKETRETLRACADNGTNVMLILKDITTVNGRWQCLKEWQDIVKAEIENF